MKIFVLLVLFTACSGGPEVKIGDCIQRADRNDSWMIQSFVDEKIQIKNMDTGEVQSLKIDSNWMISSCPSS